MVVPRCTATTCLVLALMFWCRPAPAQGPGFQVDFDKVEITTSHVAGQVHMTRGARGNIGVFAGADGDAIVCFHGSDVNPMGDVFRSRGHPIFDRRDGSSYLELIEASELVLELAGPNTKIIPGHGIVSSREDLKNVGDRIFAAINAGKSLEQTTAEKPTADFDEHWSRRRLTPDEIVEWIYAGLAGTGYQGE